MVPAPVPSTKAALSAVVAIALDHGLARGVPVVLREGSNLLVWLRRAPVVARVPFGTAGVRAGDAWLERELAIAGFLARSGAPVVSPSGELSPGPHRRDGVTCTFWEHVPQGEDPPDARAAGTALRACHELLAGWGGGDRPAALARWGALSEASDLLGRLAREGDVEAADAELLREALAGASARVEQLDLPLQPIHGDAHLGNVLAGPAGPLWNDWEDAFLGPRGWDVACLYAALPPFGTRAPTAVGQAYRGYDDPLHVDVLRALVGARRVQMLVWGAALARTQPRRHAWFEERVAALRERQDLTRP